MARTKNTAQRSVSTRSMVATRARVSARYLSNTRFESKQDEMDSAFLLLNLALWRGDAIKSIEFHLHFEVETTANNILSAYYKFTTDQWVGSFGAQAGQIKFSMSPDNVIQDRISTFTKLDLYVNNCLIKSSILNQKVDQNDGDDDNEDDNDDDDDIAYDKVYTIPNNSTRIHHRFASSIYIITTNLHELIGSPTCEYKYASQ